MSSPSSSTKSLKSNEPQTDWKSIYVATSVGFVGAVQYSLYFASMWPFLQTIDATASENFFGLIIAIYSLGQMIASPLVGTWSNKIRSSVPPLQMGLILMIVGNAIYFFTPVLPVPFTKKYVILIARAIGGFGSANVSLLKAYASTASTGGDRSNAIAYVTGGIAMGLTMGPAFQLFFTPLGTTGITISTNIQINIYTAPALAGVAMNVLGIILVKYCFVEKHIGVPTKADVAKYGELPPYDKVAVFVCYVTRFCQMFIVTNLESIGTPLAMTMFAWDRLTVVRNVAIAQALQSLSALMTYVVYIKCDLGKKINSKTSQYYALGGFLVFHFMTYSWPFLPGSLVIFNNDDVLKANGTELVGCNTDYFDWCYSVKPVNVWLFYGFYVVVVGVCLSNFNISLNTLFSKIIGPRPQAAQQGWLQVSGGAAKFAGPLIISGLYTEYGPRWAWNIEVTTIMSTFILWIVLHDRMVPLEMPAAFSAFQDPNDPDVVPKNDCNHNVV